jgi:hypothetical protein
MFDTDLCTAFNVTLGAIARRRGKSAPVILIGKVNQQKPRNLHKPPKQPHEAVSVSAERSSSLSLSHSLQGRRGLPVYFEGRLRSQIHSLVSSTRTGDRTNVFCETKAPMSTGNVRGPEQGATKAPTPSGDWMSFSPSSSASSSSESSKGASMAREDKSPGFVDDAAAATRDGFDDSFSSDVEADHDIPNEDDDTRRFERYEQRR